MEFVKQKYWNDSYKNIDFLTANDRVTSWMDDQLKQFKSCKNCFEVGCYPARYLSHFGLQGIIVNGIDLTPNIDIKLPKWFEHEGIKFGELVHGDFSMYCKTNKIKYPLVYSVGFVEHFDDYLSVISNHCDLVADNGILIITAPNFAGYFQQTTHKWLDNENLGRHNLKSMDPYEWSDHIKTMGYEIHFSGYFGGFDFWVDKEKRTIIQNIAKFTLYALARVLKWLPSSKLYSPYCGIVAIKAGKEGE